MYEPLDWGDLDKDLSPVNEEDIKKAHEVDLIFYDMSKTNEGKLFLKYLIERYIDNYTVAYPGMDPLEIGIRQGKATLVREILGAIDRASKS
jgi:hypothetical protein